MSHTPIIFSIEGNIGSGKSTLVSLLQKTNKLNFNRKIIYLQEPVALWDTIRDENGKTMLEKFYLNQEQYAFSFQMMAYISRTAQLREVIRKNPRSIILTERSVYTDKNVFAKMLYDDKKIEKVNYTIYLKWFDEFIQDIPLNGIIYVKTDPEICSQRIIERKRIGETIPLSYSIRCHQYHQDWIRNATCPILTLDGNCNFKTQIDEKWIKKIRTFIEHDKVYKKEEFDSIQWLTGC